MRTFIATFIGRKVGAIGMFYRITTTVQADSPSAARTKLYDTYEHVHGLTIREQST